MSRKTRSDQMGAEILLDVEREQLQTLRLDGRGRVTIPKGFRDHYGLEQGDSVKVALLDVVSDGYVCDECGQTYALPEVLILNRDSKDERVVCGDCMTAEDRLID